MIKHLDGSVQFTINEYYNRYMMCLWHWEMELNRKPKEYDSFTDKVVLSARQFKELESLRNERIERENRLFRCTELNNRGMALEKHGEIDEAIATYEQNILPDCYPALHSYDRLLVLYRKRKDYENELRVCEMAIKVFSEMPKYAQRRDKILALIAKAKSKS